MILKDGEEEAYIRAMTGEFAAQLHVRMPEVRFVNSSAPCGYDPLFNRIELGHAILGLPSSIVRVIVAHEVGHAMQRKALLREMVTHGLGKGLIVAVPWLLYAWMPHQKAWDIVIPVAAFVVAYGLYVSSAPARESNHGVALQVEADRSAALLCGSEPTLRALETLSTCTRIRPERLEALRARVAHEQHPVDASQKPGGDNCGY
ncbi:hypothetical protein BG58_16925 [Caballeronia jiangsuensis]|nr:hypothetical protein BG58_16925 [Caballeronia jiangsuensis]